jgi:hypothetical protein
MPPHSSCHIPSTSDQFSCIFSRPSRSSRSEFLSLPITASPHHRITASPHHRITASPHHRITASPHHRITASPHHPITPSPHHPITPSPIILPYFFASLLSKSTYNSFPHWNQWYIACFVLRSMRCLTLSARTIGNYAPGLRYMSR